MNLRSSLRALALAGVCALPLPAGVLTFTFTESTPSTVSVTAQLTGALSSTNWQFTANYGTATRLEPTGDEISLNTASPTSLKGWAKKSGVAFSTSGWGSLPVGDFGTGADVTSVATPLSGTPFYVEFGSSYVDIYLPSSYALDTISTLPAGTVVFNTTFSALGVTAGQTMSYLIGSGATQDTVSFIISGGGGGGGGGGSSVPDAGPGPALALLLGGLGLRQWRSSRRARAAS